MRHRYRKRRDTDMLIVHPPSGPELTNGENGAPTSEATEELVRMRARVAAAASSAEREALLAEIQDRFGNEAARDTVDQVRAAGEEEA